MVSTGRRRVVVALLTGALAVGLGSAGPLASPAAAASPGGDASFVGHGWGHGRGMGQYGALGYAKDYGWNYNQILEHYYGGTSRGDVGNPTIRVELIAQNNAELRAIGRGLVINGVAQADANVDGSSVRVTQAAGGQFLVQTAATCAVPGDQLWTTYAVVAGPVTISTVSQATSKGDIRVCEASGERSYRGSLTVQNHLTTGVQTTFNVLPTEDYLRGVVPHESPDSWGDLPNGLEALKAQAVAARSYALSGARASGPGTRPSGADTCDTTTCQVYLGAGFQYWSATWATMDGRNSDVAIAATAGQVRFKTGTGTTQRTEFSSSTGGYTAGGTFPAVEDLGDAVSVNPYSTWTASMPLTTVAARLGVGTITSINVTRRNGLGADGGRVLTVVVTTSGGAQTTFTGDQMRILLGLRSDWFTVSGVSLAESQSVVKALYQDLLGRGPDPTGLAGWSAVLVSGTSQSQLVASLTNSDEYLLLRATKAYREVLGREPEPGGAQAWLAAIRRGDATVDDVQRTFYDSDEYMKIAGGTPDGYVRRLFTTMLGRSAGDSEVAAWVGVFQTQGRGAAADGIWFSMEAARVRAGAYYQTFLGRGPDPTGLAGWASVLLAQGEGAVRTGIAGSQEYHDKAIIRYP